VWDSDLNESTKNVEVNFSGEFIYTQFVDEKIEQCKHHKIYMKTPQRGKITVKRDRFH